MTKCSFKFCKSVKPPIPKNDGMAYFRFPRHLIRRENWIEIVRRQRGEPSFEPNTSNVVCSKHFNKNDYYLTNKGARLKGAAVPFIDPVNLNACIEDGNEENDIINKTSTIISKPNSTKLLNIYQCSIKTSDNDAIGIEHKIDISDDDTNFDTNNSIFSGYENPYLSTDHNRNSDGEEIGNIIKIEVEESSNSEDDSDEVNSVDGNEIDISTRDLDKFGERVAAMLKRIPINRALDLQPRIIKMITSVMKEDDETRMIKIDDKYGDDGTRMIRIDDQYEDEN